MVKLVKQGSWYTDSWAHRFLNGAEDAARYTLFRAGLGGEESYKKHVRTIAENQARRRRNRLLAERSRLLARWERDGWLTSDNGEKLQPNIPDVPSDDVAAEVNARLYGGKNTRGDIGEHRATKRQGYASTGWAGRYLGAAQPKYKDLFTADERQNNPQLGEKDNSRLFGTGGSKAMQHVLDTGSYFVPYVGQTMFGRDVAQHTIDQDYKGLGTDVATLGIGKVISRAARPAMEGASRSIARHSPRLVKRIAGRLGIHAPERVNVVSAATPKPLTKLPSALSGTVAHAPNVTIPEGRLNLFFDANHRASLRRIKNVFKPGTKTWERYRNGELSADAWTKDIEAIQQSLKKARFVRKTLEDPSKLQEADNYIAYLTKELARRKAIVRRMPNMPENPHASWSTNYLKRPLGKVLQQGTAAMAGASAVNGLQNAYNDAKNGRIPSAVYNAGTALLDAAAVAAPLAKLPAAAKSCQQVSGLGRSN